MRHFIFKHPLSNRWAVSLKPLLLVVVLSSFGSFIAGKNSLAVCKLSEADTILKNFSNALTFLTSNAASEAQKMQKLSALTECYAIAAQTNKGASKC